MKSAFDKLRATNFRVPGRVLDELLARVALAAGFRNAKQLGASFHHETGQTPTAYRRNSR